MPGAHTNCTLYLLSRRVIQTGLRNSVAQMWIKKVQIADVKIPLFLVMDVYTSCLVHRPKKRAGGGLCLIPTIQMPSVRL